MKKLLSSLALLTLSGVGAFAQQKLERKDPRLVQWSWSVEPDQSVLIKLDTSYLNQANPEPVVRVLMSDYVVQDKAHEVFNPKIKLGTALSANPPVFFDNAWSLKSDTITMRGYHPKTRKLIWESRISVSAQRQLDTTFFWTRKGKTIEHIAPEFIEPQPPRPDEIMVLKPMLYLYPTAAQTVNVRIQTDARLAHTYPRYAADGWTVEAQPDGQLVDKHSGRGFYGLYWEAVDQRAFAPTTGFVVKNEELEAFLEEKLATLGLNRREANEFIVYWLPRLAENPYNLIHFSTETYTERFPLQIQPAPETLIRVFMVYKPLDAPQPVEPQQLQTPQRRGFTVVEWGGTAVKPDF